MANTKFHQTMKTSSKATHSKFKLADILNSHKNKITSIDMPPFKNPTLNHLNATIKKIYRNKSTCEDEPKNSTIDRKKSKMKEQYLFYPNDCGHLNGNQLMPISVPDNCAIGGNSTGIMNHGNSSHLLFDGQNLHASTCNLAASNQTIVYDDYYGNSATNLKYCSLRSYKQQKCSQNGQLNSTYYHFQNIDGDFNEVDAKNGFDVTPPLNAPKMPWKHRDSPSVGSSSSSGASIRSN